MGLLDWVTGNRAPLPSAERRPTADLKQALLAFNADDKPWIIDDVAAMPGVITGWIEQSGLGHHPDLVARWKFEDERWQQQLADATMSPGFRVLLRFDEAESVIRSVDHETQRQLSISPTNVTASVSGWRGQQINSGGSISFNRGADGKWHRGGSNAISTNDIVKPLRRVAADYGWGWHGVVLGQF